jgi:hypothetical protein
MSEMSFTVLTMRPSVPSRFEPSVCSPCIKSGLQKFV